MLTAIVPETSPATQPEVVVWTSPDGAPYVHLVLVAGRYYPARIVRTALNAEEKKMLRASFRSLREGGAR